jgi:phage baseplate assembly protein W
MNIQYPFQIDGRGRTAATGENSQIREMIEQLLFTNPGERVNQPDLGTGLLQMVFAPNSTELAAALQLTVQASLQRFLGDLINLQQVQVTAQDSVLTVVVQYVLNQTQQGFTETFVKNT